MLNLLNYANKKNFSWNLLTWHKTNPIPTCNNKYLNDTEYIVFMREKGVSVYGDYHTKKSYFVTPVNKKEKQLYKHPTIKPVDIIENLIINSSKENDVVLDCFMGSGTTGVACKKLNRNFIGMELNEEYFEIAKKRINEEEPNQTNIFDFMED
jgi:DNA modification methylase